ncbi:ABC transporter permease [Paenibacillus sp. p3-SID867]|uniref:ABC transporter permease n=1 Tax=Paenibacillus sp. p3-SID867 TaxID=2916363 RepID=UPI0021A362B6|nr:ABC transporter permease [Paenibacillus sp. p3-SID867]MCT1401973.1 ABC transporter permease [Paenibacillus sp. p3-SID867]
MHKWWRHSLLELRLLFGNPLFASLPIIYAILFIIMMLQAASGNGPNHNLYTAAYSFHMLGHTMTLGPAMLIGILSIRRDVRRRSFEWNHSLPVSFFTLLSSKYVVSLLYFSLFTLSTSVIFYILSVSQGIAGYIAMMHTMQFAVQYEVSYMVTLALAMLLGASIPNRIVYLIGFCAWMFGTFFMEIYIISELRWMPAQVFHLNQFFLQSNRFEYENWGYDLFGEDLMSSRWFVLAFTFLLLTVCLFLLNRKRPTMLLKAGWLAVLGAVVLTAAAAVPYGTLWAERYAQIDAKLEDPTVSYIDDPEDGSFYHVSSYDIKLKRLPNDELRVMAKLTIPASELSGMRQLPLTLNRMFKLERVQLQGIDAPYRRQGDRLSVRMVGDAKGGDIQAELEYRGKVMDFMSGYSREEFSAYSVGPEVKLDGFIAWYPLPGHQHVYLKSDNEDRPPKYVYLGWEFGRMRYSFGEMKLEVEGYPVPLYTGMQELERRPGYQRFEDREIEQNISLYGGRFWKEIRRNDLPITVVTTPYMEKASVLMLRDMQKKYDYFSKWVPAFNSNVDKILYLGQGFDYPRVDHRLILSSNQYTYNYSNLSGEWMNSILFGNQDGFNYYFEHPERDVRGKISSLFWYVYYVEEKGLSDKQLRSAYGNLRSVQQLLFKNGDGDDPQNKIGISMAQQVRRALEEGRGEQVKELLVHFYQQGLMLPSTERNSYLNPESPITYKEWQQKWNAMLNVK